MAMPPPVSPKPQIVTRKPPIAPTRPVAPNSPRPPPNPPPTAELGATAKPDCKQTSSASSATLSSRLKSKLPAREPRQPKEEVQPMAKKHRPAQFESFLPMVDKVKRWQTERNEEPEIEQTKVKKPVSKVQQRAQFQGLLPLAAKAKRWETKTGEKPEIEQPADYRRTDGLPLYRDLKPLNDTPIDAPIEINPFAKRGPEDPYFGSNIVVGLTKGTFKTFIEDVDSAFVLFYDPNDEGCSLAKSGVKKAAAATRRPNHVYAGVDCTVETELCKNLSVSLYPTIKLYAKGAEVNTFSNSEFISADQMRLLVERTPTTDEWVPTAKCTVQ